MSFIDTVIFVLCTFYYKDFFFPENLFLKMGIQVFSNSVFFSPFHSQYLLMTFFFSLMVNF